MTQLRLAAADHRNVLFQEDATKGRIVRVVAGTITDEEHIRYPL